MAHRAIKNEQGYSLMEILFGLGLLGIIIMVANGQMFHVLKQARKVTDMGKHDSTFRGFGQRFMFDLQLADVALNFQRLPIPLSGCTASGGKPKVGPCVYKLENKKLVPSSVNFGQVAAVDFFSDFDSALRVDGMNGSPSDDAKITLMKKINNTQAASNTFATWVLKDETSTPFTMMSRTHSGAYFTLANEFASSQPAEAAGRFVMMKKSSNDIDAEDLKGRLMVVFNGYSPNQYLVQKIGQVIDCKKGCDKVAKALNPMADTSNLADFFAIELQPLTKTPLNVPVPAPGLGSWGLQTESLFMFPTQYASFHVANHPDFVPPVDARRMLHFYHSEQVRAQLLAVPIEFKGYYFEKTKGSKKRLLSKKITGSGDGQVDVVLSDVDKDAYGVFARKIGTQDVSFFIYHEEKK